jgi:hypothetical protein
MILAALFVLAAIGAAAWGPGHHLEFARRLMRARRRALSREIALLIGSERHAFWYGNIAADIVHFKGFGGHYNHCHRWTIVGEMQALAASDAEQAFTLGYLAHLAADTIAHNHFVPYHLARYARSKALGHLYWEMRADHFIHETLWRVVAELKNDRSLDPLDALVHRTVPKRLLSDRANKLLFNHVLLVAERERWRSAVARVHDFSRAPLDEEFLERFRHAAVGRIRLALSPGGIERLHHIDTNGKLAQREAWAARKKGLRRLAGRARRTEESRQFAERFLEGMESPPSGAGDALWASLSSS